MPRSETRYQVESVVRACRILDAFHSDEDRPRLQELAERTGLNRSTALRLLRTLESCGLIARTSPQRYRCLVQKLGKPVYRIGFTVDTLGKRFRREVFEGLDLAADERDLELLCWEGGGGLSKAVKTADKVIRAKVDLVIDFQTGYEVGRIVAARYREAGIPLIAVDTPHPGATFFGVNNYVAGRDGGRWLADWTRESWQSRLDGIVLMASNHRGVISSRLRGALAGLQERMKRSVSTRIIEAPAPRPLRAELSSRPGFAEEGPRGTHSDSDPGRPRGHGSADGSRRGGFASGVGRYLDSAATWRHDSPSASLIPGWSAASDSALKTTADSSSRRPCASWAASRRRRPFSSSTRSLRGTMWICCTRTTARPQQGWRASTFLRSSLPAKFGWARPLPPALPCRRCLSDR